MSSIKTRYCTKRTKELFYSFQNNSSIVPGNLQLWVLDAVIRRSNELTLLIACANQDVSNQAYFALAVFEDNQLEQSISESSAQSVQLALVSFSVLKNHTENIDRGQEEMLQHFRLLAGSAENRSIYAYDKAKVLCLQSEFYPATGLNYLNCATKNAFRKSLNSRLPSQVLAK